MLGLGCHLNAKALAVVLVKVIHAIQYCFFTWPCGSQLRPGTNGLKVALLVVQKINIFPLLRHLLLLVASKELLTVGVFVPRKVLQR